MTTRYMMFSDDALAKFRNFCAAAGFANPQGAFDAKPEFARDAIYEQEGTSGIARALEFLRNSRKLSDSDLETIEAILTDHDGKDDVDTETIHEENNPEPRFSKDTAFDKRFPSASKIGVDRYPTARPVASAISDDDASLDNFNKRFPSASRIGHV